MPDDIQIFLVLTSLFLLNYQVGSISVRFKSLFKYRQCMLSNFIVRMEAIALHVASSYGGGQLLIPF